MRLIHALAAFVLLVALLSVCVSVIADESIVTTTTGQVQGQLLPQARAFRGIPFAAPPTGDLRFELPQPATPWSGVFDATYFKAGCPQRCDLPPITCPTSVSEDCLFLNVWTPRVKSGTKPMPVMIWLAGGHFDQGSAEDLLYDAEFLVNVSNVIVVEPNYRLGALGWLKTFDIDANLGLYDQRLAFRWVIDNIAAFGGDPTEITLFGQSAGATSTASHLIALGSREFGFKRAIMESNPWGLPLKTTKQAEAIGDSFLHASKCLLKGKKCLKELTVNQILDAQAKAEAFLPIFHPIEIFFPFTPVVDGYDLTQNPLDAFIQGNFSLDVSIISGTVANESLIFIYEGFPTPMPADEYHAVLDALYPGHGKAIAQQYPVSLGEKDCRPMLSVLGTDALFTCPARAAQRGVAKYSTLPNYNYYYNHMLSFSQAFGPNYTMCQEPGIVCHAAELPIVFHSAQDANFTYTAEEVVLVNQMGAFWTNLATSGDPNTPQTVAGSVQWPAYTTDTSISMQFATPSFTETFIFNDKCDFWDSVGYFSDI